MKKFFSLFLIALLGGVAALGVQSLYFSPNVQQEAAVSYVIPSRTERVPASLVNHLENFASGLPDFTVTAQMTVDAVVHIQSEFERRRSPHEDFFRHDDFFDFFFGPRRRPSPERQPVIGTGSGVILSADGYIITNNHVIDNASRIEVTLNDNRMYEAELIGSDPTTDLALLKIQEEGLPYLEFGDSDNVLVGEWVLAIGNPFNLESTVTAGIVSAKGRNINILTDTMAIESFIQTDAAVNRGNSGGALVNARGELIGINTAIASTTGAFAGYSFAVPSNIVSKVTEDIIEYGQVQRGMLGVTISPLTGRQAEQRGLSVIRGAYVESVGENSAAAEAGIREGDVILKINDNEVRTPSDLIESVGRKRPGDEVKVLYYREGRERETTATLKNIYGEVARVTRETREVTEMLGARFETVPEQTLQQLNIEHGVRVANVSRGVLASAGIRQGFIITHIDNQEVRHPDDVTQILDGKSGGVLIEGVTPDGTRAYFGVGLD